MIPNLYFHLREIHDSVIMRVNKQN